MRKWTYFLKEILAKLNTTLSLFVYNGNFRRKAKWNKNNNFQIKMYAINNTDKCEPNQNKPNHSKLKSIKFSILLNNCSALKRYLSPELFVHIYKISVNKCIFLVCDFNSFLYLLDLSHSSNYYHHKWILFIFPSTYISFFFSFYFGRKHNNRHVFIQSDQMRLK